MARKNLIEVSDTHAPKADIAGPREGRPIAGFVPVTRNPVPVGGITKTLGVITEKMERAQNIERQLAEGQMIVELDPGQVDNSFINDRLGIDQDELEVLVEQIRDHGQQVPILVRPHPKDNGRFQVAYGHRRLAASRQLGVKVRAVVRELTDDQLVVSQGQENNARTNLSYIERALFASRLDSRGFSREITMAALGVDKAALSKMLTIMRQVPMDLIVAIGAAPEIGRRRWLELGEHAERCDIAAVLARLAQADAQRQTSDQRFHLALSTVTGKIAASKTIPVDSVADDVPVRIKKTRTGSTFVFNDREAPGFDEFVKGKLDSLFAEFKQTAGG